MKFILLIILLIFLSEARPQPKYDKIFRKKDELDQKIIFQQEQYEFDQMIDHLDEKRTDTFKQRYWIVDDFYSQKSGSVFIYLCGDTECEGVPEFRLWIAIIAEQLKGLIVVLEHRFYGESLPFGKKSFSLESMKYLSSQQALRDSAYFIETVKKNNMHNVKNNPWVVIGGFYAGVLSAWLRQRYPNLVIGAIASSAVINFIEDFKQFDDQVYNSTLRSGNGTFCPTALNNSIQKVETLLYKSEASALSFKSQFQDGQHLTNKEFSYFWADVIASSIQFGARSFLCDDLMKDQTSTQQFNNLVRYAKFFQVYEYGSYYLKDQEFTYLTTSPDRPWLYQCCTEFGFFQTFSKKHPMRSLKLDLVFYKELCQKAFGPSIQSYSQKDKAQYRLQDIKGTNIIFTNGIQDPWRGASLQKSTNPDIIAKVIDCKDCAFCVDLYTPKQNDGIELKKARDLQFNQIQNWIKNYKLQKIEKSLTINNAQIF